MNAVSIIDTAWHPLANGYPLDWASGWGQDRYGAFVEFTWLEVTQRLRWIPPGRFWMGSPEGEPGRYDDEGPRHQVTLTQGFWLFDTPCTQALWEAVMGENPSRFQSPTRPVEQVRWDDVRSLRSVSGASRPDRNGRRWRPYFGLQDDQPIGLVIQSTPLRVLKMVQINHRDSRAD